MKPPVHHITIVLRDLSDALNWVPIMPRDASLSTSGYYFFPIWYSTSLPLTQCSNLLPSNVILNIFHHCKVLKILRSHFPCKYLFNFLFNFLNLFHRGVSSAPEFVQVLFIQAILDNEMSSLRSESDYIA